jgi:transcriptional regulator
MDETMSGTAGTSPFERYTHDDVQALIADYPLAWVSANSGDPMDASLLPLIGVYGQDGALTELIGHLPRNTALCAALIADPAATVLFRGPDAYVSPEHAERRDWGPTWNYAKLAIHCTIEIADSHTEMSLDVLGDVVEAGRPAPWRKEELGERYPGMLSAIIGFRARIIDVRGRFKLGQDERLDTLQAILRNMPDPAMRKWMQRFNADRL